MSESVSSRLATLTPAQRALYELALKKKEKAAATAAPAPALAAQRPPQRTIPRAQYGDRAPLSIDQERLWFIQQLDLESPVYNVYSATRYKAKLEVPYVALAVNELVRRHEILRTTYPAVDGKPVQQIAPHHEMNVLLIDLTGLPEDRREAEADRASNQVVTPPFHLDRLPILRIPLVKVHDDDFVMPNAIHHIASDRVSYDFINVELFALYQAFREGKPSPLPEPGIQFADFAIWQRQHLESPAMAEQIDYWRSRLEGAPELLRLPADHPRPPVQTPWGARRHMMISREQADAFKVLAQREEVTLFIAGLALFKAFLVRLTGEERLIVGTPMDYRQGPEMEGVQGFYLNQLALYTDLTGNPTVHEVVQRVRETAVGAYAHHDLPFAKVVELLRPERDLSRIPFTQVVFLLITPHPTFGNLRSEEIHSRPFWVDAHRTQFDMTFAIFWQEIGEVAAIWEHNTDLYDGASVNRWKEQYRTFWAGFVADRGARLWDLPMLPEAQRRQVLYEWNDRPVLTGPAALPATPVHERIAAQAALTPEATAVEGAGLRLTYAELERRANGIAQHLRRLGIGAEDLVGVCLERSPDLVASLLGVWKAGAAYLPLDPSHPAERLGTILEDSRIRALVSEERLLAAIPGLNAPRRILLDKHAAAIANAGDKPLSLRAQPESLAYTIYTSGSTGRPKGVQISHGALASFLDAAQDLHRLGPDDAWLAVTTISFDIAGMELWLPLLAGARVVLADRETATDGVLLGRALAESGATVMQATPSGWRVLLDIGGGGWEGKPDLRLLCGGEALPEALAERLRPLGKELWNQYGPTEATVWSTTGIVGPAPAAAPLGRPLGRPLANTRLYLLDSHLGPVPQGTPGELWLGGAGLARGYLGKPDLTAERFLPDPFSGEPGARLYRTGDLARHLPDGEPAFLGRVDQQIKLRGYRIELGEIEAALRSQPAIGEAVVLLADGQDGAAGDPRLVAFVVPRPGGPGEIDGAELRTSLQSRLPDPMVPSAFVALDELPQTPAGKVDRRALARRAADSSPLRRGQIVAPRNPAEEVLAGIWAEVLGLDRTGGRIGVYDDFFALGGHSLVATQLLARIQQAFGVALPVQTVFRAPTVAAQAGMIAAARAAGTPGAAPEDRPIVRLPRPEFGPFQAPLSFAQERMWFLDRLAPGTAVYNMPVSLRITGALNVAALERTFAAVVRRHETLRTVFSETAGKPTQVISPPDPAAPWPLPVSDFPEGGRLEELARDEALAPFDLARGPLLRTRLLRFDAESHVLMLTLHHIVSDLWSMGLLVREVVDLYAAFAAGEEPQLPEPPVQYADFAVWQRELLQGDRLEEQLAFWRGLLAGAPASLDLPTDRPRPAAQSFLGSSAQWAVGPELAQSLAALGRRQGATLFMTLAAALSTLLSRLSGQDDLVLGIPIAGRRQAEVEGLIGMFVNSLPLRVKLAGAGSFVDLLERVGRVSLDAFEHQDVPFEKIVEDLQPRRDLSRHPLFQAVLSVQNVPLGRLEIPGLALDPVPAESALTKFDFSISASESEAGLAGRLEYASDLFDAGTVERWLRHFRTLLAGIAAGPDRPLADLPLLTGEERHEILVDWNRTAAEYPHETIHALFAEQARLTPEAVAVVCGDDRLTYRELRERAGRLARRLRSFGVGTDGDEVRVGLLAERSPELIVGLLGILEAGGTYVPLDPAYPPERLQFVLGDAAVLVLVAERRLLEGPLEGVEAGRLVVRLGDEPEAPGAEAGPAAVPAVHPDRLAYVMYTSGSTGEPKGVMVTHRNVVRLVRSAGGGAQHAVFGPDRTFLQFAPVAFDASTLEIWGPLLSGGRLVLFPGERASLDELAEAVSSHGVDSLWLTAGLFHSMVDHRLESLRPLVQLLAGGDVVSAPHAQRALAGLPGIVLVNGYGPTEGTTFTCAYRMTEPGDIGASVPIGKPIGNARVYVLDREIRPVPVGVAGELCAGGDGLARGYLDRPALTAERFVPDPFAGLDGRTGERLYRTGDLVRWRADGTLEFLGRYDGQVKVRGFRVEVGEIESVLARHPGLLQAAVGIEPEAGGGKTLVAYVVPRSAETSNLAAELKAFVRAWLPEPMVPSTWVFLESLPLTPNGKVDRRALAALGAASERRLGERAAYAAPRTPLEERLVKICAEVLNVERVGIYDNFFDLGGHSLLGLQLVARLRDEDGAEIPLQALFEAANFAELADWITARELEDADDELLKMAMEGL